MTAIYERNEPITKRQLEAIAEAQVRHERELKRKARERRIERAQRSETLLKQHRVSSKWFEYLCENDIFPKKVVG